MLKETKSALRSKILKLLRNQKEENRVRKSKEILKKLFAIPEFQCSQTVMFYASFDGEVDTFGMIKQAQQLNKTIILPLTIQDQKKLIPSVVNDFQEDLIPGPYGVKEPKKDKVKPVDLNELDLVIVPGIAFDKNNNRLGRGAGYYDRFLKELPSNIPTYGLAFDFQIVETLPEKQAHDIPVTRVLTN